MSYLFIALLLGVIVAERAEGQAGAQSSRDAKIANALTAAPEEITRSATVKDWPTKEGAYNVHPDSHTR